MGSTTRVVVVGAGAAGLASLGSLKRAQNVDVLLVERDHDFGGVWLKTNYPRLATHTKSFVYRFYHFRPPNTASDYATRQEVLKYFEDYVEAFSLDENIVYGITVKEIFCFRNQGKGDHVQVHTTDKQGNSKNLYCHFVVCALGFTNGGKLNLPQLNGHDSFNGQIIHSSEFESHSLAQIKSNQRPVTLLGGGKSAYDLALLFHREGIASLLTWTYRKFLWGINHKKAYSGDEDLYEKLILIRRYMKQLRRNPDDPHLLSLAKKIRDSDLYLNMERNLSVHQIRGAHYDPNDLAELRKEVKRIVSSIDRLQGDSILFTTGESVKSDLLICATGYQRAGNIPKIQIVEDGGDPTPTDPREQTMLYRAMIAPQLPELVFFTGEATFSQQLYGFSIAGEWLRQYVTNECQRRLPPAEMATQVSDDAATLNEGVDERFLYSWTPHRPDNLSGGFDYTNTEASALYQKQIFDDLGISSRLQMQLNLALFDHDLFEKVNASIQEQLRSHTTS